MRILMIAPQVFFLEKGTPLSVFYRAKALGELGHKVDILTYHLGKDIRAKNVRIIRILRVPFIRKVKAGPSWKKFPLDFFMLLKALRLGSRQRYDCVYTHEEAAMIGALLRKWRKLPHVYDMHSSLPLQFKDWGFSSSKLLVRIARRFERWMVRNSDVIVPICKNLADIAHGVDPSRRIITIENTAVISDEKAASPSAIRRLRDELKLGGSKIVLYTGTFLPIQGLDLLMASIPHVTKPSPDTKFVFVGGRGDEEMRFVEGLAVRYKARKDVLLLPSRPQEQMAAFMGLADVLVSPRSIGINAPLKIFSYMKSGKPIVATDLPIHTQILTKDVSVLTKTEPKAFAEGILLALREGDEIGRRAKAMVEKRYSYAQYKKKLAQVCSLIKAA